MEPSQACFDLIKQFEGCKLDAYPDATGIATIGYGHTSPTCRLGDSITQDQAEAYLLRDVEKIAGQVAAMFTMQPEQCQFDALVCFAFNVGTGNLAGSTLLRKLKAGDIAGAADEFLRWDKAGGHVLAGLTRRREAERELFLMV